MNSLVKKDVKGLALLRQRNVSVVIGNINANAPTTNREIVNSTGISFAKVNSITTMLCEIGLILEIGKEESSGGRRSSLLTLNPTYKYTIGCQLSHTRIHTIIGDLKGNIVFEDILHYEKAIGKDAVINLVLNSIETLISKSGIPKQKILGIGIAIAGLFNPNNEMTLLFPHLENWGAVSLKSIISEKFQMPCYVSNIANAAALAELNYGQGKTKSSILYLNIGTGLGMGIIFDGKLYQGVSGTAGEFGHISIDDHGPLCECGNLGCLEALASTKAVVNQAKNQIKQGVSSAMSAMVDNDIDKIDFNLLCQAAKDSDKLAYNILDQMGQNIGEGIVTLVNLFNPERIIIGGTIACASNLLINQITNIVQKRALEIPRRNMDLVFSEMGTYAGTIGATIPIIENFFQKKVNEWNAFN